MARFVASICFIAVLFAQGAARRIDVGGILGELGSHNESPQATSEASADVPDIIACDQLCMQCPDGRNVLIQRQRATWKKVGIAAATGVAGYFSWGFGAVPAAVAASQLADCGIVGFQMWLNRELQDDQPLVNEHMGYLEGWKAGLEKLNTSSNTKDDRNAYDACLKIVEPAIWVAVRNRITGDADDETNSVKTCLSHSKLCNPVPGKEWTTVLNTNRFSLNPFTGVEMCSEPLRQDNGTIHNRQGSPGTVESQIKQELARAEFVANEDSVHKVATLAGPTEQDGESIDVPEPLTLTAEIAENTSQEASIAVGVSKIRAQGSVIGASKEGVNEHVGTQERDADVVLDVPMFEMPDPDVVPDTPTKKMLETTIVTGFVQRAGLVDGPVPVDQLAPAAHDWCHDEKYIQSCKNEVSSWEMDKPRTTKNCIDMCCLEISKVVTRMGDFQGESKQYALSRSPSLLLKCVLKKRK